MPFYNIEFGLVLATVGCLHCITYWSALATAPAETSAEAIGQP